tara:strand:- start:977 stop:1102 length:126 start_codon:yes stop_codon:yes gene_type:complete
MDVGLDLINQVFSIIVRPLRLGDNLEKFKRGVLSYLFKVLD